MVKSESISCPKTKFRITAITDRQSWERCGSVVERWTPERHFGVRNLPLPCCVVEQDTLLPESTGNTQEAVALSRHDWIIVDWDVKPQHKQTNRQADYKE